jgi:hypothetical protein
MVGAFADRGRARRDRPKGAADAGGEIDLSAGFVASVSGVVTAELLTTAHGGWPWWAAIPAALLMCAGIGLLHGTLITRLGLPSFVVTLAGLLGWQGVMLAILGNGGTLPIQDKVVNDIANANLTPAASWIVTLVLVTLYGLTTWRRAARRRARGLVTPPVGFTIVKIAGVAVAGVVLVLVCNADRGVLVPIRGMPWVLLVVLAVATALVDPPREDEVRAPRVRHRRQRGSGTPRGRPTGAGAHPVLRAGVVHRGHGRHRLRVTPALGVDEHRWWNARALRRRRRRDRRDQPVRRARQGHPRRSRRHRDRSHRQRHGAARRQRRLQERRHRDRADRRRHRRRRGPAERHDDELTRASSRVAM